MVFGGSFFARYATCYFVVVVVILSFLWLFNYVLFVSHTAALVREKLFIQ